MCAVINLGMGDARWDCRYRTLEECVAERESEPVEPRSISA
jgi:hypothetical protein